MSLQSVRQFFADHAPDIEIIELTQSTATVALAAARITLNPGKSPRPCR
jgi:prolyl-tRNA editing enzyme YbaK/EbsC (Cys-tRNA(Pro) deacylase)